MKYLPTLLLAIVIAFLGLNSLVFAQEDVVEKSDDSFQGIPVIIELVNGEGEQIYVVVHDVSDDSLYDAINSLTTTALENQAKLDAVMLHLGIGEDTSPIKDTRTNINTTDEQTLFGVMSLANIFGARSKAALIWSHIHNEGNVIATREDLLAIAGIGDVTVEALWPLIKTKDYSR